MQSRSLKSIWSTPGDHWGQSAHNKKTWIQVLWHFFLKSLSIATYPVTVKVLSHPKGWVIGKEPPTALYISWMISNKYCLALLNTGLDSTSLDISISRSKRWLSKEDCQFFSANLNNSRIFSTHLNRVKQSEMALAVHLCTSQKWLFRVISEKCASELFFAPSYSSLTSNLTYFLPCCHFPQIRPNCLACCKNRLLCHCRWHQRRQNI